MSATENELGALHALVAKALADKIAAGEATASDFSNAIKLLKDNNITCEVREDNALGDLQKELEAKSPNLDQADLTAALEHLTFNNAVVN